jgi:hypothetical protein
MRFDAGYQPTVTPDAGCGAAPRRTRSATKVPVTSTPGSASSTPASVNRSARGQHLVSHPVDLLDGRQDLRHAKRR